MVSKRIKRTAIGIGITGGVVVGLAILFSKTDLGTRIQTALRGFGQQVGLGITNPFTGLLEGVRAGGAELAQEAGAAGADIQETFTGNRNAISDFFANLFPSVPEAEGALPPGEPKRESDSFSFSGLLNTIQPKRQEVVTLTQPIRLETTTGSLTTTGARGILTPDTIGIRGNTAIGTRAIATTQPTLTGTINTSQGSRSIAGSPALFERLASNLQKTGGTLTQTSGVVTVKPTTQTITPNTGLSARQQAVLNSPVAKSGQFIQKVDARGTPIRIIGV